MHLCVIFSFSSSFTQTQSMQREKLCCGRSKKMCGGNIARQQHFFLNIYNTSQTNKFNSFELILWVYIGLHRFFLSAFCMLFLLFFYLFLLSFARERKKKRETERETLNEIRKLYVKWYIDYSITIDNWRLKPRVYKVCDVVTSLFDGK